MAATGTVPQPAPITPPPSAPPGGPVNPTAHLAQALPGFDPGPIINAHEANLADYLNQPVRDIFARLGIQPAPPGPPPAAPDAPNAPAPAGPAGSSAPIGPAGGGSPFDPTQLIQPVTDALGTLGSGQFGNLLDPTQMFGGISHTLESAGQSVQQAMTSLGGAWQGSAATAAAAKTTTTLRDGAEVASQADDLGASLTSATATVAKAQAQLIAIINEFIATLAAIGPNIIFPWGIAAAIAAANHAITMTTEVMTETQSALSGQAGQVTSTGAPVAVSEAPQLTAMTAMATPMAAATAVPAPALTQSFAPLLQMATSLASPVGEGVGAVTQAVQGASQSGQGGAAAAADAAGGSGADGQATPGALRAAGLGKAAFGGAGAPSGGGVDAGTPQSRLTSPVVPSGAGTSAAAVHGSAAGSSATGMGAGPMMGPAPMGRGGRGGSDSGHRAASFLHTSDQGGEIVGDLGSVAPPIVGEVDASEVPDIELRL
jgi:uncharacterized protein YukE